MYLYYWHANICYIKPVRLERQKRCVAHDLARQGGMRKPLHHFGSRAPRFNPKRFASMCGTRGLATSPRSNKPVWLLLKNQPIGFILVFTLSAKHPLAS